MKKLILLLTLILAACTAAPKPYAEIRLPTKHPDGFYDGQDEAFARATLLAKQGKELPTNVLLKQQNPPDAMVGTGATSEQYDAAMLYFCQQYVSPCPKNSMCRYCQVFGSGSSTLVAASTALIEPDHPFPSKYNSEWSFYDGKKEIFSSPMAYEPEGTIQRVEIVDGKPAITFIRTLRYISEDIYPELTSDTFYDGAFFNAKYGVYGSYGVFSYKGKIGFIGQKDQTGYLSDNGEKFHKQYVYFDGRPVSPAFDAIRTESCCSMPSTQLRVFDNGALVFVGERDEYAYLTEIDLNRTAVFSSAPISSIASNTSNDEYQMQVSGDWKSLQISKNNQPVHTIRMKDIPSFDTVEESNNPAVPERDYLFEQDASIFDRKRDRLYFTVRNQATAGNVNADVALFAYDVSNGSISILKKDWTGSEPISLSPDARYLILNDASHGGACNNRRGLSVFDLETNSETATLLLPPDSPGGIDFSKWLDASQFSYTESTFKSEHECLQKNEENPDVAEKTFTIPKSLEVSDYSSASSVSPGTRTTYMIPEVGMSFSYASDIFQEPMVGSGLTILYEQGQPAAAAGVIRFSYFPKGEVPQYETWLSDYIGDIATESTLQTVCANKRWPKDMFVDCKIVQEPVPHAEFYIGDDLMGSYGLHKAAIFFMNPMFYHPGVFVDVRITDVLAEPNSPATTKASLEAIASGKLRSRSVEEFDRIIASVRFQ